MRHLDLTLTPARPLDPRRMRALVAALAALMALAALRFAWIGAWPVLPFMVIDLVLLGAALAWSARRAGAVETVRLDEHGLVVRRVPVAGPPRAVALDPGWARVELEPVPPGGNRLWLAAQGRRVAVGAFLSPAERAEIAPVIEAALRRWRGR